jgi:hypothetical protein
MTTTSKVIMWISITAVVIGGTYLAVNSGKQGKKDPSKPGEDPKPNPVVEGIKKIFSPANDNFPLQEGSKGDNVKRLQMAFNKIGVEVADQNGKLVTHLAEDGAFGYLTHQAALRYADTYPVTQKSWTAVLKKANDMSTAAPSTPYVNTTLGYQGFYQPNKM